MSDENDERAGLIDAGRAGSDAVEPVEEPMGGDPPCWAHLFGEDPEPPAVDLDSPGPSGTPD